MMKKVLLLAVVALLATPQVGCRGFWRGTPDPVMPVYTYPVASPVVPGPTVCDPCGSVGMYMGR